MARKYFGTDGIRGRVGESPVTPEFVLKLGWAAGQVLVSEGCNKVLIGKDTRISGYMFESALEAGLSAAGLNVALLGPMPTPGIAYLTRTLNACAGIVISASHNPHEDNGIKFFSRDGQKLPDHTEELIERAMELPLETRPSAQLGKADRVDDARGRYIEFCKSTMRRNTNLRGLRLVVDCANGAAYNIAPSVFAELGADVEAIGVSPDGLNINLRCGSTAPGLLQEKVLESGADVGVALDGDADRVVMVGADGTILNGDELLYIVARDRLRSGRLPGDGVVGTQMSNLGLELALTEIGLQLHRAAVGDRHVLQLMTERGLTLGGEGSGHIICLDRTTTGDGIVSALQVLSAMVSTGAGLTDLSADVGRFPQHMINVPVVRQVDPSQSPEICRAVEGAEARLGESGRVLLRPSGTEPVIRVMVEGQDGRQVGELARELAEVVERSMA